MFYLYGYLFGNVNDPFSYFMLINSDFDFCFICGLMMWFRGAIGAMLFIINVGY